MNEAAARLECPRHSTHGLGAFWDGRGCHFSVFSEVAETVELCLFDDSGRHETARLALPQQSDGVWSGYLPQCRTGQLYGYRVHGPYEPKRGLRCNPHKLLIDPYARQLAGELRWHDALHGYRVGSSRQDLSFDRRDSAGCMPKAVVVDDRYDWGRDQPPLTPWAETVIYELHVKGFTALHPDIPERERGTFGGLGHPASIRYLKSLGVTAVELLPIHAFARDRHLLEAGLSNYWGYNTLAFFAPDQAYLSDGTLGQLKWAVQQLHAAGIEVILDVVYNHSAEGSELGATLSMRGFGNAEYYRLLPDDPRHHINDTGCGNTLNFTHRRVIQLVMDSLRYWVQEFHVDGFRFDLGVTMGRELEGFDPNAGFFDALMQDPVLSKVKLISEPWDIGPGGYQVGNHPAGMAEWNGRYRDDLRRYWKGDAAHRGLIAAGLQGSAQLFDHHGRRPWASVNFVTAHDGFTLHDLVSFEAKHNEANGEENQDGSDQNESRNWGTEGPSTDSAITGLRLKMRRNILASLLFSHGTPMLLAGDEFGQTQQGNNNGYCQDNALSWLDWQRLDDAAEKAQMAFVQRAIALRLAHPSLFGLRYQHGQQELAPGLRDALWFDERGSELHEADWGNTQGRVLGLRRVVVRDDGQLDVTLLLLNADSGDFKFTLPMPKLDYQVLLDTHRPDTGCEPAGGSYPVAGHSLVLIAATVDRGKVEAEADTAAADAA